jgi:hypothetical protein
VALSERPEGDNSLVMGIMLQPEKDHVLLAVASDTFTNSIIAIARCLDSYGVIPSVRILFPAMSKSGVSSRQRVVDVTKCAFEFTVAAQRNGMHELFRAYEVLFVLLIMSGNDFIIPPASLTHKTVIAAFWSIRTNDATWQLFHEQDGDDPRVCTRALSQLVLHACGHRLYKKKYTYRTTNMAGMLKHRSVVSGLVKLPNVHSILVYAAQLSWYASRTFDIRGLNPPGQMTA